MAVLETRYAQKGERLEVAVGEGAAPATVDDFPIYDPEKRRPRS
jgi:glycine cleavage system aminomethyltransferase T